MTTDTLVTICTMFAIAIGGGLVTLSYRHPSGYQRVFKWGTIWIGAAIFGVGSSKVMFADGGIKAAQYGIASYADCAKKTGDADCDVTIRAVTPLIQKDLVDAESRLASVRLAVELYLCGVFVCYLILYIPLLKEEDDLSHADPAGRIARENLAVEKSESAPAPDLHQGDN